MKPFFKYPGGKEREIKEFSRYIPQNINNYVEPFLGGGAVYLYMAERNIGGHKYINDFSRELVDLYKYVKRQDADFLESVNCINNNIFLAQSISEETNKIFIDDYDLYKENLISKDGFADIYENLRGYELVGFLQPYQDEFIVEVKKALKLKIKKMKKIENEKQLSEKDKIDFYETILKGSLYNTIREIYYYREINRHQKSAIFFILRENSYSAMFRYNSEGKFNIPYGGKSYNRKNITSSIEYLSDERLIRYLNSRTHLFNLDFEEFLNRLEITENDFLFIDPPYDTEFSNYGNDDFTRDDQTRLANYLQNVPGKVMVVIKSTDFIYNLYNDRNFNIVNFDKRYTVNIKNRNEQTVKHLIITNYPIEEQENQNG